MGCFTDSRGLEENQETTRLKVIVAEFDQQ
jgi:hypothetical protein